MKKNKNILKDLVPYLMLLVIVSVIYYVFNMNNVKVNDKIVNRRPGDIAACYSDPIIMSL